MEIFVKVLWVIYPIIIATILIVFFVIARRWNTRLANKKWSLSIGPLETEIKNRILLRFIFFIVGGFFYAFVFFRDYSTILPRHVEYQIFYDQPGLEEKLERVQKISSGKIVFSKEWKESRKRIFEQWDREIAKHVLSTDKFFSHEKYEEYLTTHGKAEHNIEFFKHWQKYHITEVTGIINHVFCPPKLAPISFESRYKLLETRHNYVGPSISEWFSGRAVVRPKMGQSFLYQDKNIYEIAIVGVTIARFFPIGQIDLTVFCCEENNKLVPFAYAYYKEN